MHQPRLPDLLPAQEDAEGPGGGARCAVALPRLVGAAGAAAGFQFWQASVEVIIIPAGVGVLRFGMLGRLAVLQVGGTMYLWNPCMPALV